MKEGEEEELELVEEHTTRRINPPRPETNLLLGRATLSSLHRGCASRDGIVPR
jgi:hypothetical protein